MALRDQVGDISIFSVNSVNLLADFQNVTMVLDENQAEGSAVSRAGMTPIGTKLSGTITTEILSMKTLPDRVTHLDLSAITIGGVSYLGDVRSIDFSGAFTQVQQAGAGEWWAKPQNVKKGYTATVELDVRSTHAAVFFALAASTTAGDRNVVFSFTLNSVPYTLPMRVKTCTLGAQRDDLQRITLVLEGRDPGSGNYPTAPTGTVGLLAQAFNAPFAEMAFEFESKSVNGTNLVGNCVFQSFGFRIEDDALVSLNYVFSTYGAVTATTSA